MPTSLSHLSQDLYYHSFVQQVIVRNYSELVDFVDARGLGSPPSLQTSGPGGNDALGSILRSAYHTISVRP